MQSMATQITWLIANTSAISLIIRALTEANADDPVFLDVLKKLHLHKAGVFLGSNMPDSSIAEYERALKELLPISVQGSFDS